MNWVYNLGILSYGLAIKVAALFMRKAKLWVVGRRQWQHRLALALGADQDWIWIHCSSLGEFEQGRPLIEEIKATYPAQKILLTFFSPSGYEVRKNYAVVDHVCYLPLDTPRNAKTFLEIVQPKLIVHVKYDLWLNFIAEAERRQIHQVLVSALVRPKSKFLKSWLRNDYRKAFHAFRWIFTQDAASVRLLAAFCKINHRITETGDTRFDRVAQLPNKFESVAGIPEFIGDRRCIVVGSTWPKDEAILLPVIERLKRPDLCWIIAPHEIHPLQIDHHVHASGGTMLKYSQLGFQDHCANVLWIDNIGMLSRLYHYSELVYIGGGFGSGIHNTQEPAVYGNPVIFGPIYDKFQEAVDLVAAGGAISVDSADALFNAIVHWLDNPGLLAETRIANAAYMRSKTGATLNIMRKLQSLGFLTQVEAPSSNAIAGN